MWQARVCDGITGALVDIVEVESFTWERLLSARGSGTVKLPLDGTYTIPQLRELTRPWSRIVAVSYNDVLVYAGYVTGGGYALGGGIELRVSDLWALLARRGAWDHDAPNVGKWKTTVSGSLAHHGSAAILRGRTGPTLPLMGMPVTLPGHSGASVSRTYYGYHREMVGEVLTKLMDEGLDVYFKPRLIGNGDVDW